MLRVRRAAVTVVLCLGLLVCISTGASAQILNLTQWSIADGGNDHWYGVISNWQGGYLLSWNAARTAARSQMVDGEYGYLATITSQAENDFIFSSVLAGIHGNAEDGFWLGGRAYGPPPPGNPDGEWITGEAWDYANWGPGFPDDDGARYVQIYGEFTPPEHPNLPPPGMWNDVFCKPSNYAPAIVEWGGGFRDPYGDPCVIPEPAYLSFVALAIFGLAAWRKRAKRLSI